MTSQQNFIELPFYLEEHLKRLQQPILVEDKIVLSEDEFTSLPDEDNLYRKVLLVSFLDSLAHIRYRNVQSNKLRFMHLIMELANWGDWERVSISQLFYNLQTISESYCNELEKRLKYFLKKKLRDINMHRRYRSNLYGLDIDPYPDELKNFLELNRNDESVTKLVKDCQHINLFYIYRNFLVHEFREPGWWEIGYNPQFGEDTPFYIIEKGKNYHHNWELIYPIGFFIRIAKNSLNSLKLYMQENKTGLPLSLASEYDYIWNKKKKI